MGGIDTPLAAFGLLRYKVGMVGTSGPLRAESISDAFHAAAHAWPHVNVSLEDFEAYVDARDRAEDSEAETTLEGPCELQLESLFLCCACVAGDPNASRIFDSIYSTTIREAVRRIDSSPAFIDEIAAVCLDKLLVGPPPRLAQYTGRGNLRAWVKRTAARAALDAKRQRKRVAEEPIDLAVEIPVSISPESAIFCRQHAKDIMEALEHALDGIAPEERTLLRLYYADGLSVDAIGDVLAVHRSTIARRLQRVRQTVEVTVIAQLERTCGLDHSEIGSLVRGTREYQEARLGSLLTDG